MNQWRRPLETLATKDPTSPHALLHYLANISMIFENANVSQGSVATHLRFAGMFNDDFVGNILLSVPMTEF